MITHRHVFLEDQLEILRTITPEEFSNTPDAISYSVTGSSMSGMSHKSARISTAKDEDSEIQTDSSSEVAKPNESAVRSLQRFPQ